MSSRPFQARANAATSRRTPASARYAVTHGRVSAAVSRRWVSKPKPSRPVRTQPTLIGSNRALPTAGVAGQPEQHVEREGREGVEGVAVGQHQPADARGVLVEEQLADRATGVVAHEHHVAQVQSLEERRDDAREASRREVGARTHRGAVGAERPGRRQAVEAALGQPLRHVGPQGVVDQEPVDEHDDRPVSRSGLAVGDQPGRQVDGCHLLQPKRRAAAGSPRVGTVRTAAPPAGRPRPAPRPGSSRRTRAAPTRSPCAARTNGRRDWPR